MNRETELAIEELKQDVGNNDVLVRKSVKVIRRAENKGIDKDQVIEFLQDQGVTQEKIDAAFQEYRSSTLLGIYSDTNHISQRIFHFLLLWTDHICYLF